MNSKNKRKKTLIIAGIALVINGLLAYSLLVKSKHDFPSRTSKSALNLEPTTASRKRLATFSLDPSNLSVKSNEIFTLQINLATTFPLAGADAILEFNPDYLTVEKVSSLKMFILYPRLTYNNSTGQITITGINIDLPNAPNLPNFSPFAGLTFRAKKPGSTIIKFNYKLNSTTASTAVRAKDSKNILTHTNNATINIQ